MELGGFHPNGMPENLLRYRGDGEISVSKGILEKGYKAIFNPKASIYHQVSNSRMTLEYLYKRAYAQGISDSYTLIRTTNSWHKSRVIALIRLTRLWLRGRMKKEEPFKSSLREGYWNGYWYHQKQVAGDPELLKWVMKKDYFETDIC